MTNNAKSGFEVEIGDGYVDIILHPELFISGAQISAICEQLGERYHIKTSAGTNGGHDFRIRLHDAPAEIVDELQTLDLFPEPSAWTGQDLDERPDIRYIHESVAYIDPRQSLPVSRLIQTATNMFARIGRKVNASLKDGYLCFWVGTMISGRSNYHDHLLREALTPRYTMLSELSGGLDKGYTYISLAVPIGFNIGSSGLNELEFVLTEPAPEIRIGSGRDRLRFYLSGNPNDVAELWKLASTAALYIGIHPIGKFNFVSTKRLRWTYDPPPLSSR